MRGSNQSSVQLQVVPISHWVKRLIIANVGIWLGLQVIVEGFIFKSAPFSAYLSMTPQLTFENFFVWQPVTYMFLHSQSVFHILFNMISLWFFASELEYRWGGKAFLRYYFFCGVGAAVVYLFGVLAVGLIQGVEPAVYRVPVIGASGAVFGVLLAYGILFGDRLIYFFGVFPMKARVFVMVIGAVEVVTLLSSGLGGTEVANLAHIGGLLSGYIYLIFWTRIQSRIRRSGGKGRRNLRLVVNNTKNNQSDSDGPKYWN